MRVQGNADRSPSFREDTSETIVPRFTSFVALCCISNFIFVILLFSFMEIEEDEMGQVDLPSKKSYQLPKNIPTFRS